MFIFEAPLAMLAWLGRMGTRALPALVVIGIALPWIGALLKPLVPEAVFVLLLVAFLRVDIAEVRIYLRRPVLVLAASAWTCVATPLLVGAVCFGTGINTQMPELFLGLMLQAVTPPMMAAPALAALMGLDHALVLVTLIASTALLPFTAPLFALLFVGASLSIPPWILAVKLFALLAGAALSGLGIRRFVRLETIVRHGERINGFAVIVLFVFVAGVMQSLGPQILADPVHTMLLAAVAFGVYFGLLFLTILAFWPAGRERALALGFMASQRNLGLMLAATGGALPDLVWLYFALSQFPIYLSPQLLRSMIRRLLGRPPGSRLPGNGPK